MPDNSRPSPALGALGGYVGYHLRLASNAALKQLDHALGKLQLTTAMYGVLELLSGNAQLPQGYLARCVGLTSPSMVPLADKLEARGLIERTRQAHDRRTVYLALTAEGRRCWSKAARIVREHETALRANLSEAEAATLIELLAKLTPR